MARTLEVKIVGDSRDLERAFGRASKQTSSFGSSLGKVGKVAAVAAGAAGVGALVAIVKTGFEEIAEAQKVSAQTAAALTSTGGAANVTAKQIESLAGELSRMSGVDDELIQSGENLLLTFTRIRNEAGRGNDVFNQATRAITDMSVALGQDMKSSAIQVGKALNDPIRGVTALQRAGVSFTAAQKEQIKALVESGRTMEAQKLILRELNVEFGGSAKAAGETLPGQVARAKLAFEELSAKIMTALLPAIASVLEGFNRFFVWAQENWPRLQRTVSDVMDAVRDATQRVVDYYVQNVQPTVQRVLAVIQAFWDRFGQSIITITRSVFGTTFTIIRNMLETVKATVEFFLAILRGDWDKAWESIKTVVSNTVESIKVLLRNAVTIWLTIGKALGAAVFDGIKAGLAGLAGWVTGMLGNIRDGIVNAANAAHNAAKQFGSAIYSGIVDTIAGLGGWVAKTLGNVRDGIAGAAKSAYNAARQFGSAIYDGIVDAIAGLGAAVANLIKAPINAVIRGINSISLDIPQVKILGVKIPGTGISLDPIPHIPELAKGGIVLEPTVALLGERGPEAVVPLNRMDAQPVVNVYVSGSVVSERDLIDAVHQGLLAKQRRNPTLGLT